MKLKLTGLVVEDVELTKRKYLHPNATASTHTTPTIITTSTTTKTTKAKITTIKSTATTKTMGIKAKN